MPSPMMSVNEGAVLATETVTAEVPATLSARSYI